MLWVYHIWLLLCWGMFLLCLLSGGFFFFNHKWMLNFVKGFLCIDWDNHMVFIFQFVDVVLITLIDLWILKNPYIPGIKPTWSWCMIFLMCCWILCARVLLRIFASMFIMILACSFLLLWHLCQVLALGWWWPHRMSLEVFLSLKIFARVLEG